MPPSDWGYYKFVHFVLVGNVLYLGRVSAIARRGGVEGGIRKVLFFSVFQCIWRIAFSSLLFMNVFCMIEMSFGVATRVTTCLYFSCIVASCGNRCYTYSLLRCYTIYLFACSHVFFSFHLVLVQRTFCSPRIAHDSTFSLDLLSMRVHAHFACCRGPYGTFSQGRLVPKAD